MKLDMNGIQTMMTSITCKTLQNNNRCIYNVCRSHVYFTNLQRYSDTPLYKKLHSLIYGKTEYNSWISYKNRSFLTFVCKVNIFKWIPLRFLTMKGMFIDKCIMWVQTSTIWFSTTNYMYHHNLTKTRKK